MPQVDRKRSTSTSARLLRLMSPVFADGGLLPPRYTADGEELSPPLHWMGAPASTKTFALLCEDPDAPAGTFVHWLVWDIRADERELLEGVAPAPDGYGLRQGMNGFGDTGYGGPSPPAGERHRYVFRLYALDTRLDLPGGATRSELERAMLGHILDEAVVAAMYGRM
jgi:Raf kinase inhibitor-like YbhB/YbcL family protein